jgi:hypothetical protein
MNKYLVETITSKKQRTPVENLYLKHLKNKEKITAKKLLENIYNDLLDDKYNNVNFLWADREIENYITNEDNINTDSEVLEVVDVTDLLSNEQKQAYKNICLVVNEIYLPSKVYTSEINIVSVNNNGSNDIIGGVDFSATNKKRPKLNCIQLEDNYNLSKFIQLYVEGKADNLNMITLNNNVIVYNLKRMLITTQVEERRKNILHKR